MFSVSVLCFAVFCSQFKVHKFNHRNSYEKITITFPFYFALSESIMISATCRMTLLKNTAMA